MPITLRPFSANTYALSKVWFKCSSVNLRNQDINYINSQVKGWLYQDCFEKPNELVLYRDSSSGGLGLFNVKIRSLALLIRTFMETSANPNFRHSLYHEVLYRYHVLKEDSLPDPGLPPFYDQAFFDTIKHHTETTPLNVATMSTKQWYTVLMEAQVLMSPATETSPPTLLPVRTELLQPTADWPWTWSLARTKGLGSDLTAFLFRLLHHLLPTQDRVARLGGGQTDPPGRCNHCQADVEDQLHAFFACQKSLVPGLALLGYVQQVIPNLNPEDALRLELGHDHSDVDQLASVCLLSTGLKYIWETRAEKKPITLYKMRAEIEAKISILRRTRHGNSAIKMLEMIN